MNSPLNLPQKDLFRHGWIPLAIMLGVLSFLTSSSPAQTVLPSTSDLWDISQGSVVTRTSGPHAPYSDIRDMFGGAFSATEPGDTVFDDGRPPGFVHYVEWQTPVPVTVGSFNLFAVGDGPQFYNEREFAQFVLKAKSSALATNFDLTLYTLVVTNHPYTFVDPVNQALVSANITPVTAQYFRAEFTQYTAGRGYDGPRIIELDGFGPNSPTIVTQPANQTTTTGLNATFAVTASGSVPLSYQWMVNGSTPLAMETNATLVVTNVQPAESGNLYSVQVSNAYGMTNSASATLTVLTPILPSCNDLWDISQGAVVTGTSGPHVPYSDIRDMFGGTFSEDAPGCTVFDDDRPPGFVHYVEWQTPVPVTVSSFNLFAQGDAQFANQREFAQFVLKAKSGPSATNFDLTLYTLVVTNHPYTFVDPVNYALVSANITPVTAQFFRAEFTQYTAGRGYDGPRIIELDGFGPNPPVITSDPVNNEIFEGANTSFSVVAQGSAPLSYQWQENSTNIPAALNPTATNTTLVLTNLQPAQSGNLYSVVVTNQYGSTNSSNALLTVLTPGSCFTPPAGLVDWWPGEHSGLDIAGTNNGTLVGGVSFAPGEVGQAFKFNGTSGYVSIPASASLDVGQGAGLTIEAWIKPADALSLRPLTEWNNGSGGYGVHVWINQPVPFGTGPGSLYANIVDATGQGHSFVSPPGLIVTNVFQHVALTYDRASGVATFYYNGAMVAQQFIGSFALQTSYPFYLGYRPSGDAAGTLFTGEMDEVSLYNNALPAAQIQTIYAVGSGGKCKLPVIASQPQSQVDYYGTSIVLSVNAGGSGTLSYQWLDNGAVITNATNATLMLDNLQFTNAGAYSVVISNMYGVTTSAPAFLSVDPAGVSIALYSGITISGVPGLTYGIQYSTDLSNTNDWLGLTNVTLIGTNSLSFDLQPATLSRRYYRVVLGPISVP